MRLCKEGAKVAQKGSKSRRRPQARGKGTTREGTPMARPYNRLPYRNGESGGATPAEMDPKQPVRETMFYSTIVFNKVDYSDY